MTQQTSTSRPPVQVGSAGRRMSVQDPKVVLEALFSYQCEMAARRGEKKPFYPSIEDPAILQLRLETARNELDNPSSKPNKPQPVSNTACVSQQETVQNAPAANPAETSSGKRGMFLPILLMILATPVIMALFIWYSFKTDAHSLNPQPPTKPANAEIISNAETKADAVAPIKNFDSLPKGFKPKAATQPEIYTGTGFPKEIVHEKTGIELVYIPVGSFTMGSPTSEAGRNDDETRHEVVISKAFYISKYEVTQDQWKAVMGSNPSFFKNSGGNVPVENVSWNDCQKFIAKSGGGLRLPTEAEWEYACRAGTATRFNTGDTDADLAATGWFDKNRGTTTHTVGQMKPNAWGVHDMHGNVSEWCQDLYAKCPVDSADQIGVSSGTIRVVRGGSWDSSAAGCRSANRNATDTDSRSRCFGLRLVLTANPLP